VGGGGSSSLQCPLSQARSNNNMQQPTKFNHNLLIPTFLSGLCHKFLSLVLIAVNLNLCPCTSAASHLFCKTMGCMSFLIPLASYHINPILGETKAASIRSSTFTDAVRAKRALTHSVKEVACKDTLKDVADRLVRMVTKDFF